MKNIRKLLLLSSSTLLLAASGNTDTEDMDTTTDPEETEQTETANQGDEAEDEASELTETQQVDSVTVEMVNSEGEQIGTAVFEESTEHGVTLNLNLEGLPAGEYGMHIHEVGSATPPDFEDAGSHFNPTDVEHGINSETGPHVGDLPNLMVGEDGVVEEMIEVPNTTLQPDGENTLNNENGTSLIIHTEADDYESQPTGDAGDRQAGGVIFEGTAEE